MKYVKHPKGGWLPETSYTKEDLERLRIEEGVEPVGEEHVPKSSLDRMLTNLQKKETGDRSNATDE